MNQAGAAPAGEQPDIETVYDELEELEEIVDTDEELEQVRETMRVLRRAERPRVFGRIRSTFDSRDVGEAMLGSFLFGMPMIVEGGTLEIGSHLATRPGFAALTLLFGGVLVYGVLHAAHFEKVTADLVLGVVPIRIVTIPVIATGMAVVLMTAWGRVDWATPWLAASQTLVAAIVMAVGASLGDILPEPR